jgi:methylmalonyl-CoA/ethylmalonyl-CoA epimerase
MIKKFDHVGLAVQDAEKTAALFSSLFGFEIAESRTEPEAGFRSTMISREDVTFELIEPVGPQGMIQKFIERRGGGLHHISIQVADLAEEISRLKALGVQFVSDEAAEVADSKVIFIHPRSTNGLLIELIQRTQPRS